MASAILRSAVALRHALPRLLSSTTRSTPRALEEVERQFLARRAGQPTMGELRLFSSTSARRSYTGTMARAGLVWRRAAPAGAQQLVAGAGIFSGRAREHPCKLNLGPKRLVGMEGQLESINMAVKKDARGWRELREQFEQNQIKRAEVDKRHDRVLLSASAAVTLALLGAQYVAWKRRKDEMAEDKLSL